MTSRKLIPAFVAVAMVSGSPALAADAAYHHVHLNASTVEAGVRWYTSNLECTVHPQRPDVAMCGPAMLMFFGKEPTGPSVGTGIDHIGFSFRNLDAKVKALQASGVKVAEPVRDVPGLFRIAFIEDPWGTRIELVEHDGYSGIHHVHLASPDPDKTLSWYHTIFGGERTQLKGRINAVLYDKVWLLASPSEEALAPSPTRAIDHIGFAFDVLDGAPMKAKGATFTMEPRPVPSVLATKAAFVSGPDGVSIEVVEPKK